MKCLLLSTLCLYAVTSLVTGDTRCRQKGGKCQYTSQRCSGKYRSGLCTGPYSRRCCIPSGGDSKCHKKGGTCQYDTRPCSGIYRSLLCAGSASRRCCIPSGPVSCSNVIIIPRKQWGAVKPKRRSNIRVPVSKFFIHHTMGKSCVTKSRCSSIVKNIQNYHMNQKGWNDIGYSFLVGGDGRVYEGRGWTSVGSHTLGHNSKSFGAAIMGKYTSKLPNAKALKAVKNLIACGVKLRKLRSNYRLYGHRDAGKTSCPGNTLYKEIKKWPNYSKVKP